jgi:hypothetical protein
MKWLPIETAPKDGTNFLAFENGDVYQCYWMSEEGLTQRWRPLALDYHGCGCCGGSDIHPSRWMPLPEPPEGK